MTDDRGVISQMAEARERFMELVAEVRPELHRYCARMTGSIFDGEDVVQDTLAKAYFALAQMDEPPPLRPWLFRIAHNAALDFVQRYEHKNVEPFAEAPEDGRIDEHAPDPGLVEAALAVFVTLPPLQRSALLLKDLLGESLEGTAGIMSTTGPAVKAALVRARANVAKNSRSVREGGRGSVPSSDASNVKRYAELFNARNWDGLRALLAEEARLDLVSRWQRRGALAGHYFSRYGDVADVENLRAEAGLVNGVAVVAVFQPAASPRPAYFIQLSWRDGRVTMIRDFRYVPYIAEGARFVPITATPVAGSHAL